MSDPRVVAARHSRNERYRAETAALLHTVAECIEWMAKALDENDNILGALAGSGIANNLPALPSNVRHTFMEYLTDEAAAGYRADQLYLASLPASEASAPGTGADQKDGDFR